MAHIAMVFPVLFGLLFFGSIAVFFVVFGIILKKAASRPPAYGAPNSFSAETACPLVSREAACLSLIRKDFPTFDPALAYAYARDALGRQLGNRPDFGVHQVVIADYQRSRYEKNVILQAALQYREASCCGKHDMSSIIPTASETASPSRPPIAPTAVRPSPIPRQRLANTAILCFSIP